MITDLFKAPTNPLQCRPCRGKGRVTSTCTTCGSKGTSLISLDGRRDLSHWYPCHDCGNYRCQFCGGEGMIPQPQTRPLQLT